MTKSWFSFYFSVFAVWANVSSDPLSHLTWFFHTEQQLFSHPLLKPTPLSTVCSGRRQRCSLFEGIDLGIIDEAGHVRPAGVCEEGSVRPKGKPGLSGLTKERKSEVVEATAVRFSARAP